MKKKKFVAALAVAGLILPVAAGLTACKDPAMGVNVRDVYAMSALSSISYLSGQEVAPVLLSGAERPSSVTQFDVDGIKSALGLFDATIENGGFTKTVNAKQSTDAALSEYDLEMKIGFPSLSGTETVCTMYFTETATDTETEFEDGQQEVEVSTTFKGVIVYGEEKFTVRGETEVETKGNVKETSIEFRTYKSLPTGGIDYRNFVQIEQSFEHGEVEYEYTVMKDGQIETEMELEYEQTANRAQIEFQLKDRNIRQDTEYTVYKGATDDKFVAVLSKNGATTTVNVTKKQDGSYDFTYAGGFTENVK